MRPIKLVMAAFGAYGRRVELDFRELGDRKFFLITGPTGAGKTTILDAMCFALYGDTSGEREAKTVRSDHAAADMLTEVELTFAVGSRSYRVCRSPEQERPKKRGGGMTMQAAAAELWELDTAGDKLLADSVGTVTRQTEELLGFKSSQFRQVVLLPQGEFKRLLTADSVEREKIMQTLFQTEQYAALERYFKEKARRVRETGESKAQEREFILKDEGAADSAELKAKYESSAAAEQELAGALKAAEQRRNLARQALEKARHDELKLQEYTDAAAALKSLEEKAATVDEYRFVLAMARQAQLLEDMHRQLEEAKSAEAQARQEAEITHKAVQEAAERHAVQSRLYQDAQAGESKRQAMAVDSSRLRDWLAQAVGLEGEKAQLAVLKHRLDESQSRQAQLLDKISQLKNRQQAGQQKLVELTSAAGAADSLRLELDKINMAADKFGEADRKTAAAAELSIVIAKAEEKSAVLAKEHEAKQQLAEKLRRLFIAGQAALLAEELEDGVPCPVCGSLEHLRPAVFHELIPSEQEINSLLKQQQELADKLQLAAREQAVRQESRQAAVTLALQLKDEAERLSGLPNRQQLTARRQELQTALQAAGQARQERGRLEQELAKMLRELTELEAAGEQLLKDVKVLEGEYSRRQGELAAAAAAVPEEYRDLAVLRRAAAERQKALEAAEAAWREIQNNYQKSMAALAAAQEKAHQADRQQELAAARILRASSLWDKRLAEAGFADTADYQLKRRPAAYREKLQERIELYDKARQSAADRHKRSAAAAAGLKPVETAGLERDWQAADAAYAELIKKYSELASASKRLAGKLERLNIIDRELAGIGREYSLIGHLADVANGKNPYGVTFQRYVLGNLLDEVADAASLRLKMMSRGRYQLQRTDEKRRKNAQSGLELEVFDYYTGAARSVSTLSGGESFLASLALSLGLADVVQNYAGGIRLDTILVDEGFGTLDPEALDMAIKTLTDLQAGGRLVGIISHVPELKERIDARLEVTLTKQGSTARFVM